MSDEQITDAELAKIAAMAKRPQTIRTSGQELFKIVGHLAAEILRLRKLVS